MGYSPDHMSCIGGVGTFLFVPTCHNVASFASALGPMRAWLIRICWSVSTFAIVSSTAVAHEALSISDVRCSRLQLSLSPDGGSAVAIDTVTSSGGFVSLSAFGMQPAYRWLPIFGDAVYWSSDGRVIFESAGGFRVVDPATGAMRQIKVEAAKYAWDDGSEILPRFVDREVFVVRDWDVRAINIDTGSARVALKGWDSAKIFVDADGREVARLVASAESGRKNFIIAARNGRSGGTIPLELQEELTSLGNAEALALSRNGKFLALDRRVTGERAVVVVDPRTLKLKDALELPSEGPFAIGATADGGAVEWSTRFAPLPTIDFKPAAPRALRAFVEEIPNAWLEFQSQSKDGKIRIFKATELSGRVHFVRLSGTKAEAVNVPCRQPSSQVVAAAHSVSAIASADVGWVVRRHTAGAGARAPLVFVLPDKTVTTISPLLDPLMEQLADDGADLRMLIYPASWTRGRLRSGANVSVSDLVKFARGAVEGELRDPSVKGRPVVFAGRGVGALLARHLASTTLRGRIDAIFAEDELSDVNRLPFAVRRDIDLSFNLDDTTRGVPVMYFGVVEDWDRWTAGHFELSMQSRRGGARMNRCVVIKSKDRQVEPSVLWARKIKAFETLMTMLANARARGPGSSDAPTKCEVVSLSR